MSSWSEKAEPKNKRRVDEVGGEWKKDDKHPLIFHNLLCEGPQTLIFVAAPTPPLNIPKVVICIVIVVVVVCVFVVL